MAARWWNFALQHPECNGGLARRYFVMVQFFLLDRASATTLFFISSGSFGEDAPGAGDSQPILGGFLPEDLPLRCFGATQASTSGMRADARAL